MKFHIPTALVLASLATVVTATMSCGSGKGDNGDELRAAIAGPLAEAFQEAMIDGGVSSEIGADLANSVTANVGPILHQMVRSSALQNGVVDPGTVDMAFPAILEAVNRAFKERGVSESNALDLGEALAASLAPTIESKIQEGQDSGSTKGQMIGGAYALLTTAISWWARDRRKKLGADPLQLAGVVTPATTAPPAAA